MSWELYEFDELFSDLVFKPEPVELCPRKFNHRSEGFECMRHPDMLPTTLQHISKKCSGGTGLIRTRYYE